MPIQPQPIRAHNHRPTAGTNPSVRQAHNALEEAWDTFRRRPRGNTRGAIHRLLTTAQTWLREGNLHNDASRPQGSRGEGFRTTLALIGGGYHALELLVDLDRAEIARKFSADGAFFCSRLRRGDAASIDLAEFLVHVSPRSLNTIPGHHEESDFLTLVVPTLMASALAGGPRGLADAAQFFTHAARNNHGPQQAAPSEARAATLGPARPFERPAAPRHLARSPQRAVRPMPTADRFSHAPTVRTPTAMPRPEPASVDLKPSRAPTPSAKPAQMDLAAVQNSLRMLQPLLTRAPGLPQQRPPQARERAASVEPRRSSEVTQAPRLQSPASKLPAPASSWAPPQASHKAQGKRSATEAPPSPPQSRRPRLEEPRAPQAASAGEATFEWRRNTRAITSTHALFNALNPGSASGADGARFSAWLGSHWVEDAPLSFFADVTAPHLVPLAQDAAVTLTFNGYAVACSRREAGLLSASKQPPSTTPAATVTINGHPVVADLGLLRQLLSAAELPQGAIFDGFFGGRKLKTEAAVIRRLLAPHEDEAPGKRSWETVELEGDALKLPSYLLRELLLAPRGAQPQA